MTKPFASWRRNVRKPLDWAILVLLLAGLPHLAAAGDPTVLGQENGQAVLEKYSGTDAFNANISQPITNSNTPLTTIDGTLSGSGQITAPSSYDFLQVAVQPSATSDLSQVLVMQDLDFNDQYEYGYIAPVLVSGVCANGVISCSSGSWNNCVPYAWTADGSGRAQLSEVPLNALGGCYCINASCGSNLVWNNLGLLLKDLGGGVLGAVQRSQPGFVVTDVKTDDVAITYYGMDTARSGADQQGVSLSGTVSETQYYENPGQISGATEAVILSQAADPDSFYSIVTSSMQNRQVIGMSVPCRIEQTMQFPLQEAFCPIPICSGATGVTSDVVSILQAVGSTLFVREGDYESGGTGITLRDMTITTSYLGPVRADFYIATRLVAQYDPMANVSTLKIYRVSINEAYTDAEELGSELTIPSMRVRLVDATGQEVPELTVLKLTCPAEGWVGPGCAWGEPFASSGLWQTSNGHDNNRVDLVSNQGVTLGMIIFDGAVCPLEDGSACLGSPPKCNLYNIVPGLSDRCLAYANNPDCELTKEVVGGVVTVQDSNPTGLVPLPSCRTFDLPLPWIATTLCEDWWVKERTYRCTTNNSFDFSDTKTRLAAVNDSMAGVDALTGTAQYNDMRKDPDTGTWTFDTHSLEWNVPPTSNECQQVCKTRKDANSAGVNISGPVTTERISSNQNEFFYKPCLNGGGCPVGPGEVILTDCQCLNAFADAAAAMTALNEAGKDLICSSGIKR